jgi:hypothetical protein
MKFRFLIGAAIACAAPFAASPAQASSDTTCYPEWKLRHHNRGSCSSTALLSPGNDTRVNLLMLLYDQHGSVGVSNVPDYDSQYNEGQRRGEAEPFDYPFFAAKLATQKSKVEERGEGGGDFPWGTRCMSNDAASLAYLSALGRAKGISAEEKATLSVARTALKPQCVSGETAQQVAAMGVSLVKSKPGQAYARYLVGAAAFYDGDFASARTAFAAAAKAEDRWVSGAASYMLGRAALNMALERAFDNYGGLAENADNKGWLDDAANGFASYLKAYPAGDYAASARGLMRRVYWLRKDQKLLAREYASQFALKGDARNMSLADMVQEIDVKLLGELKPADVEDPALLAVLLLRDMRAFEGEPEAGARSKPISRAEIEGYRARFAGRDDLYTYLLAAHALYVADDPAAVLRLIPAASASSYLGYSRQLLRAVALDASGNAGARAALIASVQAAKHPFQRGSAELALAMHLERSKALELVFAGGSPIRDPDIRERLLRYTAGADLLRARASDRATPREERNVAVYALLYKQVMRGGYAGFLKDLPLIPADAKPFANDDYSTPKYTQTAIFNWAGSKEFSCPSLRGVASALAANAKDARGLLCLGEFVRTNGLDPDYYGVNEALDTPRPKDELGGSPSLFAGKRFSRLDAYKTIIANPAAGPENRAYALHRAVRCYAPAGYNGCDASEQPLAVRKAWFQQLKRDYPTSPWSKNLSVYW